MTAVLSVEAVQERLIWLEDTAVAVKLVGTDGAVVSRETGFTVSVVWNVALPMGLVAVKV